MTSRARRGHAGDFAAIRFAGLFFLCALCLTFLLRLSWIDHGVVEPYTRFLAGISAGAMNLFGSTAQAHGTIIQQGSFAVEIRRGCDGIVATLLLVSACLAYPLPWKDRLWGVLAGYGLIFILNLARTVALFFIGLKGSVQTFDLFHNYVSQFVVIAVAMVFWAGWAGRRTYPGR
ncbi:MAG: exosortase H [Acidobacteria bacterium]|nr:exosortase H [Acidobacteriota bacterium]